MIGLIYIIYSPLDIRKEHKAEIAHVYTVTILLYTRGMLNNALNAANMLILNTKLLFHCSLPISYDSRAVNYIPYSGKVWQGESLANLANRR